MPVFISVYAKCLSVFIEKAKRNEPGGLHTQSAGRIDPRKQVIHLL